MDSQECTHWHSQVPQSDDGWPSLQEIAAYDERSRERVKKVYADNEGKWTRRLGRVLQMAFEHEACVTHPCALPLPSPRSVC